MPKFLSKVHVHAGLDLNQTELQNVKIQQLGADPASPQEGQFWYRSDLHSMRIRDHLSSHHIGDGADAATLNGHASSFFAEAEHSLLGHTITGQTTGYYLKATSPTTFAFAALPGASPLIAGVVQLQDDLTSTSTTLALTANQGKVLDEGKVAKLMSGTSGNLLTHNAAGVLSDAGVKVNDAGNTVTDLWSASKINTAIANATSGTASSLHIPVEDAAAAKLIISSDRADKMIMCIESLGLYRFDAESTAASNDDQIIRPNDVLSDAAAGRWVKLSASITDHNVLTNISGGTTGQYYHLTAEQHTALVAIAGLATEAPANSATTASVGTSTKVARQDHVHAKQAGLYQVKALDNTATNVANSPYTATTGEASVQLKAGENISLAMDEAGVITIASAAGGGTGTVNKYTQSIGNNSATSFTITHSLNTRAVSVTIYQTTTPWEEVLCDVYHTTLDTLTLTFANAPTVDQYTVVVVG